VAIRHLLMTKWDPIGVADEPMAADEYDSYIGEIFELLERDAQRESIEEHLRDIETKRMGLTDIHGRPLRAHPMRWEAVDELQRTFREQMLID
jgi:hypothetical protein